MENLFFDYQNSGNSNYFIENFQGTRNFAYTNTRFLQHYDNDLLLSRIENLLIKIVKKSRGLMGANMVNNICKIQEITINEDDSIAIKGDTYNTLNNFIENLIEKGGNIIKIMFHNFSHEKDMIALQSILNTSNRVLFNCKANEKTERKCLREFKCVCTC